MKIWFHTKERLDLITFNDLYPQVLGLGAKLGSIHPSKICPWQNPGTNFVVTIFVSSFASAVTWLKSNCVNTVVECQQACLKNCSTVSKCLPAKKIKHMDSQTGHRKGERTVSAL